jgi:preprotein translocase subunit SecG
MGAAFGGAGSQTLFGGRGAQTFLGKVTSVAAAIFMITSLTLSYHSSKSGSVVAREAKPAQNAPVAPPQGAGTPAAPAPAPGPAAPAPAQPEK